MDTLEMEPPHLAELNPAQRIAAAYGIQAGMRESTTPPLLIIAGAGTGKTKTLTHRVAHLVLNGADPKRILLMTYAGRMAQPANAIPWSGTFHAIGAKLLRLHAETIGLAPAFSILDRGDAEDLLDLVRDDLGLAKTRKRFPKKSTCLAIYSYAVNARAPLRKTLEHAFPWCLEWETALKQLFGAYVDAKQAQGALDYDDLLLYWANMMEAPEVASMVARRFDHVLVDEYQDTNALQASILLGLKPDGRGLTVVGDDAQSIYSFRSASVRNILEFPALFEPPAHTTKLEQNYRSTQTILHACNGVISRATEGFAKTLFSRRRHGTARSGSARARVASLGRTRNRIDPAQHPVREVRRPEVSRSRARQRCALYPALGGKSARPGCRAASAQADAGRRPRRRPPGARPHGRRPTGFFSAWRVYATGCGKGVLARARHADARARRLTPMESRNRAPAPVV
jgi:superfamily I DNA/RNA helicase